MGIQRYTEIPGFLDRLSTTQYKCSQREPFENLLGGGALGSTALNFKRAPLLLSMRMQNDLDLMPSAWLNVLKNEGG